MNKLSDEVPKGKKVKNKKKNRWVYVIFLITFILSLIFGAVSNILVTKLNIWIALIVLAVIIAIGILFDMIGMSVASCKEAPFHAKAAKKHIGAKEAVRLVKYSEKASSVCNDVIGDVCGVVSGAVGAMIALKVAESFHLDSNITALLMGAVVASLTVFGKAIGKMFAKEHAENIIYKVGAVMYYIWPVKDKRKVKK
ncbi:MAG: hypothetical protein PHP54_02130 [Clostridia bacterium]|nr:hypothetical protein [Clostridia bacterium]